MEKGKPFIDNRVGVQMSTFLTKKTSYWLGGKKHFFVRAVRKGEKFVFCFFTNMDF